MDLCRLELAPGRVGYWDGAKLLQAWFPCLRNEEANT